MITYEEAKKWYTQGIIDADGSIGDGIDADFYDQYGDQFQSPSTEVKGQQGGVCEHWWRGDKSFGKRICSRCGQYEGETTASQPEVGQDELWDEVFHLTDDPKRYSKYKNDDDFKKQLKFKFTIIKK